jgi:hypothetical protein
MSSDRASEHAGTLVIRLARHLNRKLSDVITLLLNHKVSSALISIPFHKISFLNLFSSDEPRCILNFCQSVGSIGAVAGFAIAFVFAWKVLRPSRPRPRPKRRTNSESNGRSGGHLEGSDQSDLDIIHSSRQV